MHPWANMTRADNTPAMTTQPKPLDADLCHRLEALLSTRKIERTRNWCRRIIDFGKNRPDADVESTTIKSLQAEWFAGAEPIA